MQLQVSLARIVGNHIYPYLAQPRLVGRSMPIISSD